MITKTFEIRDAATFIPVLAIKLAPDGEPTRYLLSRAGYGTEPENQARYILLARIDGGGRCCYDPYDWPSPARTMRVAHKYITEHFDGLLSGAVVDVEFIMGETSSPKESERITYQQFGQ